ncbi:MAG: LacI family transcriptional regulator [Lachnospiraceae bacterium]|nr:LacI family transcriptional regulator [Lachnospiraceae bacterium]
MKNNLTINDIAEMANVSKTTVSFILNGKEGISEKTRKKVLDVIEQTNYKPTLNSKRLYFQKSFTVAVVFDKSVPVFDNLFYFAVMNALLKRCMHYNYSLIYSEFSLVGDELTLPDNILDKDVDGLIFLKDIPLVLISKLHTLNIPFVIADDHSEHTSLYTVKADYQLAAYTAVHYLIQQGHRHIGFIGNMNLPAFYTQVFSGYQKALKESDLPLDLSWFFDKIQDRDTTETYIGQMLSQKELPTAIFCMEDFLAIELIRYLQKQGVRVPQDISVIAIDDIIISSQIYPSLTTVAINNEELGTYSIDILMDLINKKETHSITISSNNIVVRESVRSLI